MKSGSPTAGLLAAFDAAYIFERNVLYVVASSWSPIDAMYDAGGLTFCWSFPDVNVPINRHRNHVSKQK